MIKNLRFGAAISAAALILTSCGGGGGSNNFGGTPSPSPAPAPAPTPTPAPGTGGLFTPPLQRSLSVTDVQTIIAQAVGEAQARNLPSVITVVDRVGNVLAVFRMNGANQMATVSRKTIGGQAAQGQEVGLQGVMVPATTAAIAKAVTGAYLSSGGNAFSTRTASQIVQEHFPPAPTTVGLESGPLFGVQFSQLPCSDLNTRFRPMGGADALIGPKRSPLGLSADPGGLPLYKDGVVVGAIGVMGDGDYGFDDNILDVEVDAEEAIALAGIQGFAPPAAIAANRISVDGTSLRFSDMVVSDLSPLKNNFAAINGSVGSLIPVTGYTAGNIIAGTAYGTEASGVRASTAAEFTNSDAFVLTDGAGNNRYPIRGGTDSAAVANPLTAAEVRVVLEEAFKVLSRARAQIRQPLDSRMQATVSVVDTHGQILGIVRSPDGPIFGTDVSLQKARTAAFFSNVAAEQQLLNTPGISSIVQRIRTFLGDPTALTGTVAFADRSGGNLARPYFPDGEVGRPPGPLSTDQSSQFSPFAVGLQTNLIAPNVGAHVAFVASGGTSTDTIERCTQVPDVAPGQKRLANGIQIFPGSVPIYRGDRLVGGIGVSGDGIDQDDMVSFLGLNNAGIRLGTIGNAPKAIRADNVVVDLGNANVRLRYVNCPFAPFLDTNQQNVCEGL
ncbi:GlcG/HbpS family heme-binding protein [Parasphingorhabdus halotolerans]|uniref:Heme-binding protein n=1 Tax=Parasphingorhabdus halotolerans TaxID=2725558 RepID=A0A6H2DIC7_9SPHN|nr:heme-binding protein [Parasphingorhabdus halotolerans]QJB68140.1 heme-binding protein [Parasphingorhabdus halotolerans]